MLTDRQTNKQGQKHVPPPLSEVYDDRASDVTTNRAVNGSIKFAVVKEQDVTVAGDTEQSTVDTDVHAMYGERAVVIVVDGDTTASHLVEQLGRLQLV